MQSTADPLSQGERLARLEAKINKINARYFYNLRQRKKARYSVQPAVDPGPVVTFHEPVPPPPSPRPSAAITALRSRASPEASSRTVSAFIPKDRTLVAFFSPPVVTNTTAPPVRRLLARDSPARALLPEPASLATVLGAPVSESGHNPLALPFILYVGLRVGPQFLPRFAEADLYHIPPRRALRETVRKILFKEKRAARSSVVTQYAASSSGVSPVRDVPITSIIPSSSRRNPVARTVHRAQLAPGLLAALSLRPPPLEEPESGVFFDE